MSNDFQKMSVTEKCDELKAFALKGHDNEGKFKINVDCVRYFVQEECYRERMVSYLNMLPILEHSAPLEDADYIIYMHMYARCEDMSDFVVAQLREIAKKRKEGAEIIVIGKAANALKYLTEIENITYYADNYATKLGQRFGYDMAEEHFVYDDKNDWLAIWPVDGCMRKCKFCRRCFMDIKFESQSLALIKQKLDYYKEHAPEKMRTISLRAENLTEYGIDIYGRQMLHKVIDLINSYEEVEQMRFPIGLSIGEITPEILKSLCNCKKICQIGLNMEVGNDRLLKLIGKPHTCARAIEVYRRLKEAHPEAYFISTVMVGIPTEGISDMLDLAKLIETTGVNRVWCNYYIASPKHLLADLPQISESCREYHLKLLLNYLSECDLPSDFSIHTYRIPKKPKSRKEIKLNKELDKFNDYANKNGLLPVFYGSNWLYIKGEGLMKAY